MAVRMDAAEKVVETLEMQGEVMAEVMAMGFSTEQAKQALEDSDGSVDMAVSMLQTRFTKAAESAALRRGRGGDAGTLTQ